MNLMELIIASALGTLVILMILMGWQSVTAIGLEQAKINQTQENARFALYVIPRLVRGIQIRDSESLKIKHHTLYHNHAPLITPINKLTLCKLNKHALKIILEFPPLRGLNTIWEKTLALDPHTPLNRLPHCQ